MRLSALIAVCIIGVFGSPAGAVTTVSPDEVSTWTRYIAPLPKQIAISGKVQVGCASIAVVLPASSDIKVPQARKEIREALGLSGTGDDPASPTFTITLQLGGAESVSLETLANSDQAYTIIPVGDTGLKLVALQPAGLYYAAKTLSQMLPWKVASGSVWIPMATITDWPDMADRGVWGSDHYLWLRWMSDRKMNIGEQIAWRYVTADRVGHSAPKAGREPMNTEGPYYGVQPVHATLHLEQVYNSGLFTYYPEVIGVGGQYGCICYSNGAFTHVLADWICDLASLPYVDGVDVWMAENLHGLGGCHCAQCSLHDRNLLEAQTIVAAWNEAKARLGRYVKLWILTSEETYDSNNEIFGAIPSDVRVWYYESLRTYITGRAPIISTAVANLASNPSRYAGVCPSLSVIGTWQPFKSAEFMNYRMNEFVTKKLKGLLGYAIPDPMVNLYGFNLDAAAEWSWNASGRSLHEWAVSYGLRTGMSDPEKFAEWADAIGKVNLDLYGSDWPNCEGRASPGYVADLLLQGDLPELGYATYAYRGPWAEFTSSQQFDDDKVLTVKAVNLAKEMGVDEFYYESVYADGLLTALRALYKLKPLVVGGTVSLGNRETARYYFGIYNSSIQQAIDAIQQWSIEVSGSTDRVADTVAKLQECIYGNDDGNPGMQAVAVSCGCTPTLTYLGEPAVTIADAKKLGAGAAVSLYGRVVTGSYGSTKFLQETDRTCAIKVITSASLADSAPSLIYGIVQNINGELVVNAEIAQSAGATQSVRPVAMPLSKLGGGVFGGQPAVKEYQSGVLGSAEGLNNIGLYVRAFGLVTYVGADHFYIDDGSSCDDGSGHAGLKVICADASWGKPALGDYVIVNGMSSTYYDRSNTWRAIYVTSQYSIELMPVPYEIILDEHEATTTGTWNYTPAASGAAYNDDYYLGTTAVSTSSTVRWTPNIGRAGTYDVYVMYCSDTGRTTAAPYTVVYSGGSQTYAVNQTIGGGTWQLLCRQSFAAGTSGYVQLSNGTGTAGAAIVADAIKLVRVTTGTAPTIITQPVTQYACSGTSPSITLGAAGTSPVYYQWRKGTTNLTDGGEYSGATTNTLTFINCDLADAATNYNCVVTNLYGSVTSNNASLIVGTQSVVPTALTSTGVSYGTITWNWSSVTGAQSYTLWTAPSGGTQIGGTITGTSYTESGLDPGTLYNRYVQVNYGCGASTTRTQLATSTIGRYSVQNGDFESGFTSGVGNQWTKGIGSGTFAQSTSIKRDGTSSQKITDALGGDAFTAWMYQKLNVQPSKNYTVKVYHRRAVTSGCVVEIGISYNGGVTADFDYDGSGSANVWALKQFNFTSGATGLISILFRAGYNAGDSSVYLDGVYINPQAPTSTGGSTTISAGQSATITASGGFDGSPSELHWYTGAGGTGTHVGTGTSLAVSPAATTAYYPRWESYLCPGNTAPSSDGTAVTVTVN